MTYILVALQDGCNLNIIPDCPDNQGKTKMVSLTKTELEEMINGDTDKNEVIATNPPIQVKKDWVTKIEQLADIKHLVWRRVPE